VGPNLVSIRRNLSFSFAGPRNLDEVIKKELIEDKTSAEVADIWYTYHESKVCTMVMSCCFLSVVNPLRFLIFDIFF